MNSRRQILKLLGIAPAAATSATAELAAMVSSPAVTALTSAATVVGMPAGQNAYGRLGDVLGRQISKLRDKHDIEINAAQFVREGGLDPDIAALRSTARVYRVRKQLERDIANRDLYRQVNEMMWG